MRSSERRANYAIAAVLVLLGIAALRDLAHLGELSPWRTMDDFPDFYCAGAVLQAGKSPYTYEPLRTCEHRVNAGDTFRAQLFAANPAIAIPAPLPPYDFVPFMGLARLPFHAARAIDAAAILAAVAFCVIALSKVCVPFELSLPALVLSTAYMELNTGQIVPFALLALVLCALALARRHDRLAGVLAVLTAIEPAVGLPVVLATLLFVPGARLATVVTAGFLAVVALTLVSPQTLFQYTTVVLPAQAASEVHFPFQYSLTYALAHLGLRVPAAIGAGAASYAAMLVTGLVLAPALTRRLARRELLVFVPALCSVIGGTYLHAEELCFGLPALLVLTTITRGWTRNVLALALCALSIPWILVWGSKKLFLASVFVCAVILFCAGVGRRLAIVSLCLTGLLIYIFELHPPHLPVPSFRGTYASNALVQDEWKHYAQGRSSADPLWFAIKLPAWAALLAALGIVVRTGRSRSDLRRVELTREG
ncbi:MAG: DUF2029 domain-containing protein [Candidatus Eremiobacteraeota bacterium]|nr:DUF2029 domain-containing protein [Candidatus Eremiobacteraeota bacterium]